MIHVQPQPCTNERINSSSGCQNCTRRNRTTPVLMRLSPLLLVLLVVVVPTTTVSSFPNGQHRTNTCTRNVIVHSSSLNENNMFVNDNISQNTTTMSTRTSTSSIDIELEQQINQGLQRAKEVLQKSKAKLAAMQENADIEMKGNNNNEVMLNIPFFASR